MTARMARLLWVTALVAAVAGCSGAQPVATSGSPAAAAARCAIPPRTYDDLQACDGEYDEIEIIVAKSRLGKTTVRIAVASQDPTDILAAMGAAARKWSTGADSFTVWAYATTSDYGAGAGYNRGMIFWNERGEITVRICTAYSDIGDGMDFCDDEAEYLVQNE